MINKQIKQETNNKIILLNEFLERSKGYSCEKEVYKIVNDYFHDMLADIKYTIEEEEERPEYNPFKDPDEQTKQTNLEDFL